MELIQLIVYNGDCLISPFLHLAVLRVFRIQSILVIFFAIAPLLLNIGLYWVTMLDAFGWLMVLPNAISDILASIFWGHRFHGTKTRLFGWL